MSPGHNSGIRKCWFGICGIDVIPGDVRFWHDAERKTLQLPVQKLMTALNEFEMPLAFPLSVICAQLDSAARKLDCMSWPDCLRTPIKCEVANLRKLSAALLCLSTATQCSFNFALMCDCAEPTTGTCRPGPRHIFLAGDRKFPRCPGKGVMAGICPLLDATLPTDRGKTIWAHDLPPDVLAAIAAALNAQRESQKRPRTPEKKLDDTEGEDTDPDDDGTSARKEKRARVVRASEVTHGGGGGADVGSGGSGGGGGGGGGGSGFVVGASLVRDFHPLVCELAASLEWSRGACVMLLHFDRVVDNDGRGLLELIAFDPRLMDEYTDSDVRHMVMHGADTRRVLRAEPPSDHPMSVYGANMRRVIASSTKQRDGVVVSAGGGASALLRCWFGVCGMDVDWTNADMSRVVDTAILDGPAHHIMLIAADAHDVQVFPIRAVSNKLLLTEQALRDQVAAALPSGPLADGIYAVANALALCARQLAEASTSAASDSPLAFPFSLQCDCNSEACRAIGHIVLTYHDAFPRCEGRGIMVGVCPFGVPHGSVGVRRNTAISIRDVSSAVVRKITAAIDSTAASASAMRTGVYADASATTQGIMPGSGSASLDSGVASSAAATIVDDFHPLVCALATKLGWSLGAIALMLQLDRVVDADGRGLLEQIVREPRRMLEYSPRDVKMLVEHGADTAAALRAQSVAEEPDHALCAMMRRAVDLLTRPDQSERRALVAGAAAVECPGVLAAMGGGGGGGGGGGDSAPAAARATGGVIPSSAVVGQMERGTASAPADDMYGGESAPACRLDDVREVRAPAIAARLALSEPAVAVARARAVSQVYFVFVFVFVFADACHP
jgi:hypothetical protein